MKDPAVLIYFDKWISATNGMKAEFRAWYFDLLIYQYDKGFVPSDEDELAGICRVRPSEYDLFKQMLNQVLNQKFSLCEDGNYRNGFASEILQKRKEFKDKRARSGNIGVIIRTALLLGFKETHIEKLKLYLFELDESELDKHKDKQVLNHLLNLYIDEDVNKD